MYEQVDDAMLRAEGETGVGEKGKEESGLPQMVGTLFICVATIGLHFILITYQKLRSGDGDLCYYNFACMRSVAGFEFGNHELSNLPLFFWPLFFLGWNRRHRSDPLGAAAVATAATGITSAFYHVCPSQHTITLDLAFIYVACAMFLLHLKRLSGEDLNKPSHAGSILLLLSVLIAAVGIVRQP